MHLELQASDDQLTIPKVPPRTPSSKQKLKKDNSLVQFGIQWQCYSLGPVYILAQIKLYFKAGICCLWYSRNMITHILTLDESLQSSTHSPRN